MLVKNQEYQLTIEDIGTDGEGIGHIEGIAVFVKDTVMGDVACIKITKAKKNYAYGRLVNLIKASPIRVTPVCPNASRCGGCSIQHISYEKQLEYKWNKVRSCLERIGGLHDVGEKMEPICGMEEPFHYRNKAQFPIGRNADGSVAIGFYAGRTHTIIDTGTCYLQAKINDRLIQIIREYVTTYEIETYDEAKHTGLLRHVLTRVGFVSGEIMVCLVINGTELPHSEKLVERLVEVSGMTSISINHNTDKTNRILGDLCTTLWGQDYITDFIGDIQYQISPLSFYQVNPVQTKVLYEKALSYAQLTGNETVWDLYCGIGTISLFLAQRAKQVYGVEIVPQAIADAKQNARINGIQNTKFYVGKAEEVLPREYQTNGIHADVIVVDPPRKGCEPALLMTMVEMQPKRIVYVSCDPATLARDAKILEEQGYQIEKVGVVDQFCHTVHVECVCLLSRK